MMILKSDLQNPPSLIPPVQHATTCTNYGIVEERPEGRQLHQQLEIMCSHDSLATAMLMGTPEVDERNSFAPNDPRLLVHIEQ